MRVWEAGSWMVPSGFSMEVIKGHVVSLRRDEMNLDGSFPARSLCRRRRARCKAVWAFMKILWVWVARVRDRREDGVRVAL